MCSLHCSIFKTDTRGMRGTDRAICSCPVHGEFISQKWVGNKIVDFMTKIQIFQKESYHSHQDNFCLAVTVSYIQWFERPLSSSFSLILYFETYPHY